MTLFFSRTHIFAPLVCGALLGACTGTKDPGEAGFLDGVRNQADGTYTEAIEAKKAERTGLEGAIALLESDVERKAAEQATGAARLRQARKEAANLNSDIAALRSRYEADSAQYSDELARLDVVQASLNVETSKLQTANASSNSSASLAELRSLAAVVDALPK